MKIATPETWKTLDFTSLIVNNNIKKEKIKTLDYLDEGEIPIIDQGKSIISGYTNDSSLIYKGDLPVIVFGDHTLVLKFIDFPFAIGADGTKIIHTNKEKIVPKFFYYVINYKNIQPEGYKRHFSKLRNQQFLIPPLPEQQQIESILSNVDVTIQKTDQIIDQSQHLKNGIISKLLTRGINHTKFKTVKFGFGKDIEIPEECTIIKLGDVFDIKGGIQKTPRRKPLKHFYPYLRVGNVFQNKLDLKQISYFEITKKELEEFKLNFNDLLVVEGNGDPNQVGRTAVWHNEIKNCVHQNHIIRCRPSKKIDVNFISYFLNFSIGRKLLTQISITTSGLYSLSVKKLFSFPIVFFPLSEQQQIVSILTNIDAQIQKENLHKLNLERLKTGLMQKLLTGQIRVKV